MSFVCLEFLSGQKKMDFGYLSRVSWCPIAWTEQQFLQNCWTSRSPQGTASAQMYKNFPEVSQHSWSHMHGWGHQDMCEAFGASRTCHTVGEWAHVRGSSWMPWTHLLWQYVLPACILIFYFFFPREISRRNIEALVTLACLLPLHLNSQGLLLPCTEWVGSSVGFCNVVEVTPPWVMMNWSCVCSSRGCPWAQTHKLITWFTKLPPASQSDWSIAGGKKTRIPPLCVQPHRASTSTRGSGGAHLVLLEPSGNTSLCICFSKSWMHPALQDTDRETERFWAGEVEAAWKQNWDWFVSMWVNMGFPYPFCDQEKVGNYCNLNLKKLSKIQSKH